MNLLYSSLALLFNLIFGWLATFVLAVWMICFMYVAEFFGYTLDPTLDEGLFLAFLPIAVFLSILYLGIVLPVNRFLMKKTALSKSAYIWLASLILTLTPVLGLYWIYFLS